LINVIKKSRNTRDKENEEDENMSEIIATEVGNNDNRQ
jgi:hypothetical protein